MIRKNVFSRWWVTFLFTVICLLISGSLVFCANDQLKFSLILEKAEYAPDEPINVVLNLKNLGSNSVIINQRFYISSSKAEQNQKEVYFELTSPTGVKLPCLHFYPTGYPKTDYFKLLGPGEETKSEYPRNLRGYFEMAEPGTYTVTAVYQNVFGAEIGLDTFKEELVSAPVKFTIINTKK